MRKVVITGLGPLSSTGVGKTLLWKGIRAQKTGLVRHKLMLNKEIWDSYWYHKIRKFDISDFQINTRVFADINSWKRGKMDRDLLYLIAAVKLALDDSKLKYDTDNNSIGLYITIEHPGFEPFITNLMTSAIDFRKRQSRSKSTSSTHDLFKYLYTNFVQYGYDLQTFMHLFFVAKIFGLHGYSLFTNNACASGLYSLEAAARQIRQGQSDVVIIAGGDDPGTFFKHMWFKERGLYAEDGKIRPFSQDAGGIVFGEGASSIILEDLAHAKRRKARIYAEYIGGGFCLEGWKVTIPMIGSNSYTDAINQALRISGIKPNGIDLINPHGVGLKITDHYEAKAITEVFGTGPTAPRVSAFKPYVGHNLGGSGILETILLLLAMQNKSIPPTLNAENYDHKYGLNLVKHFTKHPLNTTMKLSCGFAGYNAAAIFKNYA